MAGKDPAGCFFCNYGTAARAAKPTFRDNDRDLAARKAIPVPDAQFPAVIPAGRVLAAVRACNPITQGLELKKLTAIALVCMECSELIPRVAFFKIAICD